jgi:hypothetical protein
LFGRQRIPSDGWFTLTGEPGQEVVAVVATRDAQALSGSGKTRIISAVERAASSHHTRLQSALPPGLLEAGHATMGVRGQNLSLLGKTVRVSSYDPVVMILDIDHRAAGDFDESPAPSDESPAPSDESPAPSDESSAPAEVPSVRLPAKAGAIKTGDDNF